MSMTRFASLQGAMGLASVSMAACILIDPIPDVKLPTEHGAAGTNEAAGSSGVGNATAGTCGRGAESGGGTTAHAGAEPAGGGGTESALGGRSGNPPELAGADGEPSISGGGQSTQGGDEAVGGITDVSGDGAGDDSIAGGGSRPRSAEGGSLDGGGSSTGGFEQSGGTPDAGVSPETACLAATISGESIPGTTQGRPDTVTLSCGSPGSSDIAYQWIPPNTDYYVIDTMGSSFDTVLGVLDTDCTGAELACDDNAGSSPQSEVVLKLTGGQPIVIVVDGQSAEYGDVAVNIAPVACPRSDISNVGFPMTSTTVGGSNTHDGACGGVGYAEKQMRYTASKAGLYRFSVSSSDFGPALYVTQGVACDGPLLQCAQNIANGGVAEVTRYLEANESVVLTVDGRDGEGAFELSVQRETAACPSQPEVMGTLEGQVVSAGTGSSLMSGSCLRTGTPAGAYADISFPIHVAQPLPDGICSVTVQVTQGGPPDLGLVLLRGDRCEGEEIYCEQFVDTSPHTITFWAGNGDNGDYVLVVEHAYHSAGITLSITSDCD